MTLVLCVAEHGTLIGIVAYLCFR